MLQMVEFIKWEEGREGGEGGREGDGLEREGGEKKGREGRGGKEEDRDLYIYHNYKRTILYHSVFADSEFRFRNCLFDIHLPSNSTSH